MKVTSQLTGLLTLYWCLQEIVAFLSYKVVKFCKLLSAVIISSVPISVQYSSGVKNKFRVSPQFDSQELRETPVLTPRFASDRTPRQTGIAAGLNSRVTRRLYSAKRRGIYLYFFPIF